MTEFPEDVDLNTKIPDAFRKVGVIGRRKRSSGVTWVRSRILPVDIEIMQFLLRFRYARPLQISGWVGCSLGYAVNRLGFLKSQGFVESDLYPVYLRPWGEPYGRAVAHNESVWRVTTAGRSRMEPWPVAGEPETHPVIPKALRFSKSLGDHTLGIADLGVLYRRWGFQVATEVEYKMLEAPGRVEGSLKPSWCVSKGTGSIHAPDLGVIHPDDGSKWGVELERNAKPLKEYQGTLNAYRQANMGCVWFAGSQAVARNISEASRTLGWLAKPIRLSDTVTIIATDDGALRIAPWVPSFIAPKFRSEAPQVWGWLDHGMPPGGFQVSTTTDLTQNWRLG